MGRQKVYTPSMNLSLSDGGIAASAIGLLVLLFGRRWYWTSAAVPLIVFGLAWMFFGH